jgi:hypothetical protein
MTSAEQMAKGEKRAGSMVMINRQRAGQAVADRRDRRYKVGFRWDITIRIIGGGGLRLPEALRGPKAAAVQSSTSSERSCAIAP